MPAFVDLTGRTFGRLTVVERAPKQGPNTRWYCRCECGGEKIAAGHNLKNGNTQSCGCIHREVVTNNKLLDLTGQRFGRLVVVKFDFHKGKFYYWLCRCDCGTMVSTRTIALRNGSTQSCGCLGAERRLAACTTHGLSKTREYISFKSRERQELERKLDVAWTVEMEYALRQLQPACVVCGDDSNLSVDHVLPLRRGYGLRPGNAVTLCFSCNRKKHGKLLPELEPAVAAAISKAAADFEARWQESMAGRN